MELAPGKEILVNEAGEYLLVPRGTARDIVGRKLRTNSDLYLGLRAGQFLFDDRSSPLLDVLAAKQANRVKIYFECGSRLST